MNIYTKGNPYRRKIRADSKEYVFHDLVARELRFIQVRDHLQTQRNRNRNFHSVPVKQFSHRQGSGSDNMCSGFRSGSGFGLSDGSGSSPISFGSEKKKFF
jgi:hypothetical protein